MPSQIDVWVSCRVVLSGLAAVPGVVRGIAEVVPEVIRGRAVVPATTRDPVQPPPKGVAVVLEVPRKIRGLGLGLAVVLPLRKMAIQERKIRLKELSISRFVLLWYVYFFILRHKIHSSAPKCLC